MMNLRNQIKTYARRRKTGVTAADIQTKFGVSRSTASAALTELTRYSGGMYNTFNTRKTSTGRYNTIYKHVSQQPFFSF